MYSDISGSPFNRHLLLSGGVERCDMPGGNMGGALERESEPDFYDFPFTPYWCIPDVVCMFPSLCLIVIYCSTKK